MERIGRYKHACTHARNGFALDKKLYIFLTTTTREESAGISVFVKLLPNTPSTHSLTHSQQYAVVCMMYCRVWGLPTVSLECRYQSINQSKQSRKLALPPILNKIVFIPAESSYFFLFCFLIGWIGIYHHGGFLVVVDNGFIFRPNIYDSRQLVKFPFFFN